MMTWQQARARAMAESLRAQESPMYNGLYKMPPAKSVDTLQNGDRVLVFRSPVAAHRGMAGTVEDNEAGSPTNKSCWVRLDNGQEAFCHHDDLERLDGGWSLI